MNRLPSDPSMRRNDVGQSRSREITLDQPRAIVVHMHFFVAHHVITACEVVEKVGEITEAMGCRALRDLLEKVNGHGR